MDDDGHCWHEETVDPPLKRCCWCDGVDTVDVEGNPRYVVFPGCVIRLDHNRHNTEDGHGIHMKVGI